MKCRIGSSSILIITSPFLHLWYEQNGETCTKEIIKVLEGLHGQPLASSLLAKLNSSDTESPMQSSTAQVARSCQTSVIIISYFITYLLSLLLLVTLPLTNWLCYHNLPFVAGPMMMLTPQTFEDRLTTAKTRRTKTK